MKLENLIENKCPNCDGELRQTAMRTQDDCIACRCGYKVSRQKYLKVISKRVVNEVEEEEL